MKKNNILVVDDEELSRDILEEMLSDEYNIIKAKNGIEAIDIILRSDPFIHLVLLDIKMPYMNGLEVIEEMKLHEISKDVPVIVISSETDIQVITKSYNLGAVDYFSKPFIYDIVRKKVEITMDFGLRDYRDFVTGGYNRKGFIKEADAFLSNVEKKSDYALLFFDIKNFKAFTEIFGKTGSDELLKSIYYKLENCKMNPEFVARNDTDHFLYLIKKDNLNIDALRAELATVWDFDKKSVSLYLKCGIYYLDDTDGSVENVISRAELAADAIIDEYVEPIKIFDDELRESYLNSAMVISGFTDGIENNEFVVYYQPVIDLKTEKIASCEALVRWNKAGQGLVSPGVFIPVLERDGYIAKLDKYVVNRVLNDLKEFINSGHHVVPVSVNLSWMDFYDNDVKDAIYNITQFDEDVKGLIRYEVTETSLAASSTNVAEMLDFLKTHKIKTLLDDFGTGYSSLSIFDRYNFDILKIDMSLSRQLDINPNTKSIVKAIIDMCHEIGAKVVSEGVENETQLNVLRELNCDYIQGFYYSKPLPKKEFIEYAKKHK